MAQAFNFETRQLSPYNDFWSRGSKVMLRGALWYIKERDGIYLINNGTDHHPRPSDNLTSGFRVAKGLPAAILAQGEALMNPDFDYRACYQAYFKIGKELFPTKPAYHIPTVLHDWAFTLYQTTSIDLKLSECLDNFSLMSVAGFLREISNPYRMESLVDKLNHNYEYICHLSGKEKPQIIFSQKPSVEDRVVAPLIYAFGIDQLMDKAVLQVEGFMAAVFNLAIFYYWQQRWSEYNFARTEVIEQILKAYDKQEPIVDVANLQTLSFDLPDEVEDICKAYMEAFMPVMEKVWKRTPTVQLACIEGENIYTYIYAHETSAPERLLNSELYANLSDYQKRTLYHYGRRFLEWLVKTYPITGESQHRVMQAMGMDLPPIQLSIQSNVKVIHANEGRKEDKPKKQKADDKFKYIIADDQKEIKKIHDRIKLHLTSPSELRNELSDMQDEELISLPMDKPTEIIREVRRIWGEKAPKERSFVIAWVRRF